jgi:antagonist of KipI
VRPDAAIYEAGDSAVLLYLDRAGAREPFDVELNGTAISIADTLRRERITGVRDVVSTFHSVAVYFDPLAVDLAAVTAALERCSGVGPDAAAGRRAELPIVYGGEFGPDLEDVAAFAGCSQEAVIHRHASKTYRVFMLGFLPGFPYMAALDESIAVPRRATPRIRVPAGSVGIAQRQTGVYPCESPGGWQIVGRTPVDLFDPRNESPALLAPGDEVRFVLIGGDHYKASASRRTPARPNLEATLGAVTRFVTVIRPGLFTTIQDSGRWGYQHLGVPVSGPMDRLAHRVANAIVGNSPDAATLEVTIVGPELRFDDRARVAIAGADLQATLDGQEIPSQATIDCPPGARLRFGERRRGARAYIAIDGGIAVPAVLGSRSTHVLSGLGGITGRALMAGDRIPIGAENGRVRRDPVEAGLEARLYTDGQRERETAGARLRIMPGPQVDRLGASVLDALQRMRFTISPQSDRMGYRLAGAAALPSAQTDDMISDAAMIGGVQVLPSGQPILLMADRQTTGGYPQVAVVIAADLPRAAQLAPGDWVEFELCSSSDAVAALRMQEARFVAGE